MFEKVNRRNHQLGRPRRGGIQLFLSSWGREKSDSSKSPGLGDSQWGLTSGLWRLGARGWSQREASNQGWVSR